MEGWPSAVALFVSHSTLDIEHRSAESYFPKWEVLPENSKPKCLSGKNSDPKKLACRSPFQAVVILPNAVLSISEVTFLEQNPFDILTITLAQTSS